MAFVKMRFATPPRKNKWRMHRHLVLLCMVIPALLAHAPFTQAQDQRDVPPCGKLVNLGLTAVQASQGSLVLLEVRDAMPTVDLTGEWDRRKFSFWREKKPENAKKNVVVDLRKAVLGIDLEKPAGTYLLQVKAQTSDGKRENCGVKVTVEEGRFATENLQVGKQFVEPNPEQLERAKAEQERLRHILDGVTSERLWQGAFRLPLEGVTKGGNFGKRRILNGKPGSPHTGVDFPAPTGTLVRAPQRGRVVLAEGLYFSGNTVVLDHGLGVYTLYGHLSEISVNVGDMVEMGALLGRVGATGRVTGPHLHWGLTVERARVNPLQLIRVLGGR
jgi:murein DD-endopeptidase MepM/ murein hydrolase activator NlpD